MALLDRISEKKKSVLLTLFSQTLNILRTPPISNNCLKDIIPFPDSI